MSNYNGYSNRETWAVNLRLANNEVHYLECKGAMPDFIETYANMFCEEQISLFRVNWQEVAESLKDT